MNNLISIEAITGARSRRTDAGRTAQPLHLASTSTELSIPEEEVLQVADAVCRSTSLNPMALPDEFYPGHLTVALIDAMCNTWRLKGSPSESNALDAARYCRCFGIARKRTVKLETPPVADQETLGDLIRRFDERGPDRMGDGVSMLPASGCDATREAVALVLDAARALREVKVDVLQDMQSRHPEEIESALQDVRGTDEESVRLLLMFAGDDHFVRGDGSIRKFVASALGRASVSAIHAEELVRRAAYELVLSPRLLDYVLWTYGKRENGLAKPPAPARPTRCFETLHCAVTGISLDDTSTIPSPHD